MTIMTILRTMFLGIIALSTIAMGVKLDRIANDVTVIATIVQLNRTR